MLGILVEDYKAEKKYKPNAIQFHKLLNSKKETEFPWMYRSSKSAPQNALRNLEKAFKRFFKKQAKFPKFKKKNIDDKFTVDGHIRVLETHIQLPKIGKIRLKERNYIPIGKPKSATISKKAGRWFVSVRYEIDISKKESNNEIIGVDLGIKNLATLSDGTIIPTVTTLKEKEEKLKRLNRRLSRQKKGSNSRKRTLLKIQRLHFHIANVRKDTLHKLTSLLVKTKPEGVITIEDLDVQGMLKNKYLAKSIANIGAYEFRRQLEYKCKWYGKELVIADRYFPSSKMDHKTGEINDNLKLSDRIIYHPDGTKTDRDLNAAINLRNYGNSASSARINAGGDERFQFNWRSVEWCSSKKPEINNKSTQP